MNSYVYLTHNIADTAYDGDTKEIPASGLHAEAVPMSEIQHLPQSNIRSSVYFVGFLDIGELKWVAGIFDQISMPRQLFELSQELMMIATIVEQLNLAYDERIEIN